LFKFLQIRSVWNEVDWRWYFSVSKVVRALTDSANVRDFIKKMRKREAVLDANWGTLYPSLELLGWMVSGGKGNVPMPKACSVSNCVPDVMDAAPN
jgi:hypothetical protein